MKVRTKICGLTRREDVTACAEAGVVYIGLNFFAKSPRYVTPAQARMLALEAPVGLAKVGLVVDADDATLDAILDEVPLDMLQLHGHESVERVRWVRARYGLPVMKAVGVSEAADLDALARYAAVADQILVDAKPPKGAILPGGNGVPFDWTLLDGREWATPWMLAGGLTPQNVTEAIKRTGAVQVDTASGVETAPGVKDADLIRAFVEAAERN
ncbi:phosphoribosylanthranilate isomerase [Rhodalgimonas zhirmunskyi]|uniref:N-(5'-phosphoribosyl)anthranilate isomerase n=1 Tax=Rhodalgimonas zhirmunskyi TaxID=2964767 RepID=A0AAJ1UA05_9RHOB|nr:phosphoribosylanthranilate isomerase [Rhodoalgimonas zhirmunskyi]MDQ2094560.1 phosphoribosylanthranilate isomerase [Rhodoalgimonas zhirmunskyi]